MGAGGKLGTPGVPEGRLRAGIELGGLICSESRGVDAIDGEHACVMQVRQGDKKKKEGKGGEVRALGHEGKN